MPPFVYLIAAVCTFRATWLFSRDAIMSGVRSRLDAAASEGVRRLNGSRPPTLVQRLSAWVSEGIGCPWCSSVWWGAVVAGAWLVLVAPAGTGWQESLWVAGSSTLVSSAFTGCAVWLLSWVDPDRVP